MRFEEAFERVTALIEAAAAASTEAAAAVSARPIGPPELLPVFTDGRLRPRLSPTATARPAAVLVLIHRGRDGEARLVLTERLTYDGHHSGEVSFPGGKVELADVDTVETALREANEEIGLDPDVVEIRSAGLLDDVFIPVSDYRISPVVGLASRPLALTPDPREVARILTPPVAAFLPGAPIQMVERTIGDWPIRYGGYRIDGLHVWGATARILGQLGALLDS